MTTKMDGYSSVVVAVISAVEVDEAVISAVVSAVLLIYSLTHFSLLPTMMGPRAEAQHMTNNSTKHTCRASQTAALCCFRRLVLHVQRKQPVFCQPSSVSCSIGRPLFTAQEGQRTACTITSNLTSTYFESWSLGCDIATTNFVRCVFNFKSKTAQRKLLN